MEVDQHINDAISHSTAECEQKWSVKYSKYISSKTEKPGKWRTARPKAMLVIFVGSDFTSIFVTASENVLEKITSSAFNETLKTLQASRTTETAIRFEQNNKLFQVIFDSITEADAAEIKLKQLIGERFKMLSAAVANESSSIPVQNVAASSGSPQLLLSGYSQPTPSGFPQPIIRPNVSSTPKDDTNSYPTSQENSFHQSLNSVPRVPVHRSHSVSLISANPLLQNGGRSHSQPDQLQEYQNMQNQQHNGINPARYERKVGNFQDHQLSRKQPTPKPFPHHIQAYTQGEVFQRDNAPQNSSIWASNCLHTVSNDVIKREIDIALADGQFLEFAERVRSVFNQRSDPSMN